MTEIRQTGIAPFRHMIDCRRGLVVLTYCRQPTLPEWLASMTQVLDDPQYRPGMAILSDRRRLEDTASSSTIRAMADWVTRRRDRFAGCRWAVVVSPQAIAEYGMARMGSVLFERSGVRLQAFKSWADALDWLFSSHA